jgi:rhodanese-related sulfurtransferase
MRKLFFAALGASFLLAAAGISSMDSLAAEPARITKEDLRQRMGDPAVVIVDVRAGRDWSRSDRKISGAVREDPGDADAWASRYPKEKFIVLYCA